jgi:hypothetical protein
MSFERLGMMKLVRTLSTLVLLACVTALLGCTANESTNGGAGGAGAAAGSGHADGALPPMHEPKADEPKADEPKADEPKAE